MWAGGNKSSPRPLRGSCTHQHPSELTGQLCKCRSSPGSLCPRREKQRALPRGVAHAPTHPHGGSYPKAEERRPGSPGTSARLGQPRQRRSSSRTRAPAATRARRLSIPANSSVRHPPGREGSLSDWLPSTLRN